MNRFAFRHRLRAFAATGILLSAPLVAGCGKGTVRPETVEPGFSPAQLRTSTVWITVDTTVSVQGMEAAFAGVYGSGAGLAAFLGAALRDSLARGLPAFDAQLMPGDMEDAEADPDGMIGHAMAADAAPGLPLDPPDDGAQARHDADAAHLSGHILRATNLRVARTTRTLPTANLPSGMQPGMEPAGGGTSEGCEATFDLEVRDNATGALRARYRVTGRADVPLHAYQTALREAVQATVRAGTRLLRAD